MVCLYCRSRTGVINSRLQKRSNQVWRRRACQVCGSVVSTLEAIDYSSAIAVTTKAGRITSFSRDKLFLSIYHSCSHRQQAIEDAGSLTATVMSKIMPEIKNGAIDSTDIAETAMSVLKNFDKAALTYYSAHHPLAE